MSDIDKKIDEHFNKYFVEADTLIRKIIPSLQKILYNDGEDVSYYNPSVLDVHIMNLIKARAAMSVGREIDPI